MNKPAITDLAEQVYAIIQPHSTGTTSCSDVCGRLTGRWANLEPDSPLLAEALGLIVHRCRDAEPPLPALSAVVVRVPAPYERNVTLRPLQPWEIDRFRSG